MTKLSFPMRKILETYLIRRFILSDFLALDLSQVERSVAEESILEKYVPAVWRGTMKALLTVPALLLLDTSIIMSVLIPVTMVVGSAWFGITLANIKKKFEGFGMALTTTLFEAFVSSLQLLGMLTLFSLNQEIIDSIFDPLQDIHILQIIAAILGTFVVLQILFDIFKSATSTTPCWPDKRK